MTPEEQCLHDLRTLYQGHKAASLNPQWTVSERNNKRRIELACPLWIDAAVISGLRLEINGYEARPTDRPFMCISASLLALHRGRTWHLSRIDFDPEPKIVSHKNPPNKFNAPPIINGGHCHPFEENASLGLDALSPSGNLPIAVLLNRDFTNFSDILKIIRECFAIPELWLEEPPWSQTLAF